MEAAECLPALIERRANDEPGAVLIEEVDGRIQSYGEFRSSALRWTAAFERLGVLAGENVATILPNRLESYHAWMGLAGVGAIEVAVNEQYRGFLLEHAFNLSRARVLVTVERHLTPVLASSPKLEHLERIVVLDAATCAVDAPVGLLTGEDFLAGSVTPDRVHPLQPQEPAGVIFTSGTTGASKGVVVPWALLASGAASTFVGDRYGDYPDGAYYSPWQSCHLTSKSALDMSVRLGLRLVISESFSLSSFWSIVRQHRCTHFLCVFIAPWLWRQPPTPSDADNPLRQVSMVPLIPEHRAFAERFGVRLCTTWASTEAGFPLGVSDPVDHRSCGRLMPGYHLRIVDPAGDDVANGSVGELLVRHDETERMFGGYLGMPDETAAVMRDGWYHTADAFVRDDDGNYYFVDRMKDYIKHRGRSISAGEVEAFVVDHPSVVECACIGVPSDDASDDVLGDEEVKIVVVAEHGHELDPATLVADLELTMPRYMVPRYVEIVDALPRNHVNKVAKPKLREKPINERTWDRRAATVSTQGGR